MCAPVHTGVATQLFKYNCYRAYLTSPFFLKELEALSYKIGQCFDYKDLIESLIIHMKYSTQLRCEH